MTINELIELELADRAVHQERWQAIIKLIIIEEGLDRPEAIMARAKEAAAKLGTRLVRRSIDLGMRWITEGQR